MLNSSNDILKNRGFSGVNLTNNDFQNNNEVNIVKINDKINQTIYSCFGWVYSNKKYKIKFKIMGGKVYE